MDEFNAVGANAAHQYMRSLVREKQEQAVKDLERLYINHKWSSEAALGLVAELHAYLTIERDLKGEAKEATGALDG